MRGVEDEAMLAEARRLRKDERLSYKEIHERTGVPKGTLSGWLRDLPLSPDEIRAKQDAGRYQAPKKDRGAVAPLRNLLRGSLTGARKAKIAEAATLLRMVLAGLEVYGSPFDGDKADWVVATRGHRHLSTVQVRWTKEGKHGLPTVSLQCSDGRKTLRRYRKGEFDFIVGYDLYTDTCYVWSWDDVAHLNRTVTVCSEAAERWNKITGD